VLIELSGLPGCGKTTVSGHIIKGLADRGISCVSLHAAAKQAAQQEQPKIGFLRRGRERVSLYGTCLFANSHPDLFDIFLSHSRANLGLLTWNMEMLSQLALVESFLPQDKIILNEEGYIQRLAVNFIEDPDSAQVERAAALLPDDILTISMKISPEAALIRAMSRKKGIPSAVKMATDDETLTKMRNFDRVLSKIADFQVAKGCPVLFVDGEKPDVAEDVIKWILPRLPM